MTFQIHIGANVRKSAYFDATVADGVRSFSVYNHMYIPGHFGDPEGEYDRLLNGVAQWDVAAQRQVELAGPDAVALAQLLTPRDLSSLTVGQGRYVPVCDHEGMVINDPVLLKLGKDRVWLSVADSDLHLWAAAIGAERGFDVSVREPDVSPMAIQGPKAMDVAAALFGDHVRDMRPFAFVETALDDIPLVLARSGWSKQGGFELYLMDGAKGNALWQRVRKAGEPWNIGPGAPNDSERIESGLISYGADMRRQVVPANPFEMGMGKMVSLDSHDFIGRSALRRIADAGIARRRVGFFVEGSPVTGLEAPVALRRGATDVGIATDIAWSGRLDASIGLGLVEVGIGDDDTGLTVALPEGSRPVRLAPLPFL
ncbi:glycine cleavage system protein T [Sulfitobacter alexandrii]|uniref:Glycine cleavage system protein T n=1 Tax=Sulfitobacter alexandrii TaxID=1917485 RepID=A0A1J0WK76_9RHOB|nr:glycine cleavage T C-terminal barrel domain-containing protein [Sulfitobacter alexandrii]APE44576.1 glycine cleavage system protein T [Sulfitobacter alexandrii]